MKKTSFVIALLASALLAGACGGKKSNTAAPAPAAGSDTGSAAGSGAEAGSAAGSGSGG